MAEVTLDKLGFTDFSATNKLMETGQTQTMNAFKQLGETGNKLVSDIEGNNLQKINELAMSAKTSEEWESPELQEKIEQERLKAGRMLNQQNLSKLMSDRPVTIGAMESNKIAIAELKNVASDNEKAAQIASLYQSGDIDGAKLLNQQTEWKTPQGANYLTGLTRAQGSYNMEMRKGQASIEATDAATGATKLQTLAREDAEVESKYQRDDAEYAFYNSQVEVAKAFFDSEGKYPEWYNPDTGSVYGKVVNAPVKRAPRTPSMSNYSSGGTSVPNSNSGYTGREKNAAPVSYSGNGTPAEVVSNISSILKQRESSNNPKAEIRVKGKNGSRHFTGLYQMGEARLKDYASRNNLPAMSPEQYRNLPASEQDKIGEWHLTDLANQISKLDFKGKSIKGVPLTLAGLVGVAHLGGMGGVHAVIKGKDRKDANNTYLSDYAFRFGGVEARTGDTQAPAAPTSQATNAVFPKLNTRSNKAPLNPLSSLKASNKETLPSSVSATKKSIAKDEARALFIKPLGFTPESFDSRPKSEQDIIMSYSLARYREAIKLRREAGDNLYPENKVSTLKDWEISEGKTSRNKYAQDVATKKGKAVLPEDLKRVTAVSSLVEELNTPTGRLNLSKLSNLKGNQVLSGFLKDLAKAPINEKNQAGIAANVYSKVLYEMQKNGVKDLNSNEGKVLVLNLAQKEYSSGLLKARQRADEATEKYTATTRDTALAALDKHRKSNLANMLNNAKSAEDRLRSLSR